MTDNDIREMVAHPTFQALLRKAVADALNAEIVPTIAHAPSRLGIRIVKEAPPGMLTYEEAGEVLSLSYGTIRHYVHRGTLSGRRGFVSRLSVQDYAEKRLKRGAGPKSTKLETCNGPFNILSGLAGAAHSHF